MSMSEVQIIFPNAYNKRYTTVFDSQTIHVVNLFVGNENSDTTFSLIYNPNTNTVTEIIIRFEPV